MSLEAMVWALKLPAAWRENVSDAAHMTLLAIANHASPDGSACYPSAATLAEVRSVSVRTIRRHLSALEGARLIVRGDQDLVNHIPPDRRPIVWDLPLAVDNPSRRGDEIVTPLFGRGDTESTDGVTPGVLQTTHKPSSESYVLNSPRPEKFSTGDDRFAGAVATDNEHDDSAGECIHGFSAGVSIRTGKPWCPYCRRNGVIVEPRKETSNA